MAFLFLFSYVLLFNFDPIDADHPSIHPGEIIVIIAVSCMFFEEIRIVSSCGYWCVRSSFSFV